MHAQSTADALDDDEDAGSSFECASVCVSVSLCVVMRARKCVAALGANFIQLLPTAPLLGRAACALGRAATLLGSTRLHSTRSSSKCENNRKRQLAQNSFDTHSS